jgi:hypothetical protein
LEAIARSRELLVLSEQRLNREEAAVRRAESSRDRQQATINREASESEREMAAGLPDPGLLTVRASDLRKQSRAAIAAFAEREEEIARLHEAMAKRTPEGRESMLELAAKARAAARQAHEALRDARE